MARDYQRTKNNPWILPKNLYRKTLWSIRDYQRIKEEYEYLLQGTAIEADGQPRGTGISDPTSATAIRAERLHDEIRAVENAKKMIPEEYMLGIWQSIVYDAPYPHDAGSATYGRYKSKFVYHVAKNLYLI